MIEVTPVPGGTAGDVTRTGLTVVARPDVPCVRAGERDIPSPWVHFPRGDEDGARRLLIAAKGHDDLCYLWTEPTGWKAYGPTKGNYSCEVLPEDEGWQVYVQRTSHTYEILHIGPDGKVASQVTLPIPTTDPDGSAQGFWDGRDRELLWTDQGRIRGSIVKPTLCGDYLVGQDGTGPDRVVLATPAGVPLRVLYTGWTDSPRATWVDGQIVLVTDTVGDAVVVRGKPEDFPAWTPATQQPPPKPDPQPEPQPEPEPIPVSIPNYLADVDAARAKYPAAWAAAHYGGRDTDDFVILLARDLSKADARVGVNGKRGNPQDISDDCLAIRGEGTAVDAVRGGPMEIIDVIGSAGSAAASPAWNVAPGGPGDRGTWIDPWSVQPSSGGEPPPDPQQPPPVATTITEAQIKALIEAALRDHEHVIAGPIAEMAGRVGVLAERVESLTAAVEQIPQPEPQAPQPMTLEATIDFQGYAGRLLGDGHKITGTIKPVEPTR